MSGRAGKKDGKDGNNVALQKLKALGLSRGGQRQEASKKHCVFSLFFPRPPHHEFVYRAARSKDNGFNFCGLILGHGGATLQRIQKQSGTRIEVRDQNGNLNGSHPDPNNPNLHAHITSDDESKLQKAVTLLLEVLKPIDGTFEPFTVKAGGSVILRPVPCNGALAPTTPARGTIEPANRGGPLSPQEGVSDDVTKHGAGGPALLEAPLTLGVWTSSSRRPAASAASTAAAEHRGGPAESAAGGSPVAAAPARAEDSLGAGVSGSSFLLAPQQTGLVGLLDPGIKTRASLQMPGVSLAGPSSVGAMQSSLATLSVPPSPRAQAAARRLQRAQSEKGPPRRQLIHQPSLHSQPEAGFSCVGEQGVMGEHEVLGLLNQEPSLRPTCMDRAGSLPQAVAAVAEALFQQNEIMPSPGLDVTGVTLDSGGGPAHANPCAHASALFSSATWGGLWGLPHAPMGGNRPPVQFGQPGMGGDSVLGSGPVLSLLSPTSPHQPQQQPGSGPQHQLMMETMRLEALGLRGEPSQAPRVAAAGESALLAHLAQQRQQHSGSWLAPQQVQDMDQPLRAMSGGAGPTPSRNLGHSSSMGDPRLSMYPPHGPLGFAGLSQLATASFSTSGTPDSASSSAQQIVGPSAGGSRVFLGGLCHSLDRKPMPPAVVPFGAMPSLMAPSSRSLVSLASSDNMACISSDGSTSIVGRGNSTPHVLFSAGAAASLPGAMAVQQQQQVEAQALLLRHQHQMMVQHEVQQRAMQERLLAQQEAPQQLLALLAAQQQQQQQQGQSAVYGVAGATGAVAAGGSPMGQFAGPQGPPASVAAALHTLQQFTQAADRTGPSSAATAPPSGGADGHYDPQMLGLLQLLQQQQQHRSHK